MHGLNRWSVGGVTECEIGSRDVGPLAEGREWTLTGVHGAEGGVCAVPIRRSPCRRVERNPGRTVDRGSEDLVGTEGSRAGPVKKRSFFTLKTT